MGNKYEVLYWDYYTGKEVTVTYTDSFRKALWLVRKYEKKWHCVSIKFRRNRVKETKVNHKRKDKYYERSYEN